MMSLNFQMPPNKQDLSHTTSSYQLYLCLVIYIYLYTCLVIIIISCLRAKSVNMVNFVPTKLTWHSAQSTAVFNTASQSCQHSVDSHSLTLHSLYHKLKSEHEFWKITNHPHQQLFFASINCAALDYGTVSRKQCTYHGHYYF